MDRGNHELGTSSLLSDELDESRGGGGKKIRPRLTSTGSGSKSKSVSCSRTPSKLVESVMLNVSSVLDTTKTNTAVVVKKHMSTDKPPEPYADIIAKAILSNTFNLMQLKEIYTYMSDK